MWKPASWPVSLPPWDSPCSLRRCSPDVQATGQLSNSPNPASNAQLGANLLRPLPISFRVCVWLSLAACYIYIYMYVTMYMLLLLLTKSRVKPVPNTPTSPSSRSIYKLDQLNLKGDGGVGGERVHLQVNWNTRGRGGGGKRKEVTWMFGFRRVSQWNYTNVSQAPSCLGILECGFPELVPRHVFFSPPVTFNLKRTLPSGEWMTLQILCPPQV